MSLYFLLGSLTHDGQRMLHGNPNLIADRTRVLHIAGAEILGQYAVLGRYDFVMMVEADDNDAVFWDIRDGVGLSEGAGYEILGQVRQKVEELVQEIG